MKRISMHIKSLVFFLIAIPFCVQAQTVTISGMARSYENQEVSAWVTRDFISNTGRKVASANIDSSGNFTLEFDSKQIQYLTLKIDNSIASLYIEPNATYEVKIGKQDSTTYLNPYLDHDVDIQIKLKSKSSINALTIDYDKRFDDFLAREYVSFVRRRPIPKIDTFKVQITDFYLSTCSSYFDRYVEYSIATLEEKVKVSRNKLFDTYINNRAILFGHQEYFNFFNAFYKQYLREYSLQKGDVFKNQIDVKKSFKGAIKMLRGAKYLPNDTVMELVLIKGLYESYHDGTFKKEGIINVLEEVTAESSIAENRQIAQNILNSFSKLKHGEKAPYFELPDKTGKLHRLDELHAQKAVYYFFFDQQCTTCLQQLKVVASMQKKYYKHILFVGISLDETEEEFQAFCKENPSYTWLLLHDTTGGKLKQAYEIRSLPAYYLIDKEGRFIEVPAESIIGDIERAFFNIVKPKGRQHQVGDKGNK